MFEADRRNFLKVIGGTPLLAGCQDLQNTSRTEPTNTRVSPTETDDQPAPERQSSDSHSIRVGILADPHYNDSGMKRWGSGRQEETVTEFIDVMNNEYHPDFVVVLGDNIHGNTPNGPPSESQMLRRAERLRRLLEADGGTANSGLSAPVKYLLGNHEYKWPNRWDMGRILSAFDYQSFSDTFSHIDLGRIRLLFLNTAFNETNDDVSNTDQYIPGPENQFNAIRWIEDRVYEHDGPIVAFGHHSLDYGEGTNPYDSVGNQHRVAKTLTRHGQVIYVHGHTHHGWGYTKLHSGPWGLTNLFVNETEDRNYGRLTINPGGWRLRIAKTFRHKGPLGGTFGSNDNYAGKQQKVRGFSVSETLRHESLSRATVTTTGDSSVRIENTGLNVESDTTDDEAKVTFDALPASPNNDGYGWQERRALWRTSVYPETGRILLCQGSTDGNHIGFEILDGTFYGVVGNESGQQSSELSNAPRPNGPVTLGYYYDAFKEFSNDLVRFYVNGEEMLGDGITLESGVLPQSQDHSERLFNYQVSGGTATIDTLWYEQPYFTPIYHLPNTEGY